MIVWLLVKHPKSPYRNSFFGGTSYLEAFTIEGQYQNHAEAINVAKDKNKRSSYHYRVKKLIIKTFK